MHEKNLAQLLMYDIELFNNLIKNINRERATINKILTERQFFVLLKIYNCKKMELKNLSKELNVSTSSLCILVDQNYVYREEDRRDRRNTFYGITEIGEKIINDEMKQISSILESKFMMLSVDERKIMIESLQNIKRIAKKFVIIDK